MLVQCLYTLLDYHIDCLGCPSQHMKDLCTCTRLPFQLEEGQVRLHQHHLHHHHLGMQLRCMLKETRKVYKYNALIFKASVDLKLELVSDNQFQFAI